MIIRDSARKHGISDLDISYVYEYAVNTILLNDSKDMVMAFGFDSIGRGLEIGYITNSRDEDVIIHAMKIRPSYKKHLLRR